jgi:glutamine---fructose-6-phosphate transaminase (isomerizing)
LRAEAIGVGKMPSFAHEMLREIYEQPDALRRTMRLYLPSQAGNGLKPDVADLLAEWSIREGEILIAASGSSRHSGLFGDSV